MVYVPAGTYRISSSIQMLVQTMLVGDPLNKPTLKADANLGTKPIIEGFDQSRGLQSTTNFWIGIRNIKLDTTAINVNTGAVALNWPVSQACQLTNVDFIMPNFSQHIGITMRGGGSGTIMQDLVSFCTHHKCTWEVSGAISNSLFRPLPEVPLVSDLTTNSTLSRASNLPDVTLLLRFRMCSFLLPKTFLS